MVFNTGDNTGTPQAVVSAMLDEMARRGLGSSDDRLRPYKPGAMIQDPQTAIVEVYAYIPPGGSAGQRIDVYVQAVRNSHSPSGSVRPISSATGMNFSGRTRPRSGWRQRTSASTLRTSPVCRSSTGW